MDWRKNRIAVGAIVFVALLGLTLWVINRRDREPTSASELPTLELDRDAITELQVTRPNGDSIVLSNASGAWRVVEPLDAEADENNVETALNRLADLRVVRIVATRPENYARLQVDDENAVAVVVKADQETLANLGVGKYADGMTMLRIDERTEVFGASGSLRYAFDRDLKAWRNRRVVTEDAKDVSAIRFESPNGTFQFDRNADVWIASAGAEALGEFDSKKVAGVVSSAARLMASGFAAEDVSPARAGLSEPNATVTLTMAEGAEPIVLEIGAATEAQDEMYLRRRGDETIYVVSEYLANRLRPDAQAFDKTEEPQAPPPAVPAMPQGQGQPQLPPDVMRQIRQQIEAQQRQKR